MKFSTSSASLRDAVNLVHGATAAKNPLPILDCILLERNASRLRLTATDLRITVTESIPVLYGEDTPERNSRIAVPARRFADTLRALPDVPLSFESKDEFSITLTTDHGSYTMVGYDGADYPALPDLSDCSQTTIDSALFRRIMTQAAFAVSKEEGRPAMKGVLFELDRAGGRAVTTDGHRLVRFSLDDLVADEPMKFVLPPKALALASRGAVSGPCTVLSDGAHVCFESNNIRVLARIITEPYPNYQAVIPKNNHRHLRVDRAQLLSAIQRVALYSSTTTNQIQIAVSTNQMTISAEDLERSSNAREVVACEYTHEDLSMGYKGSYVLEVLKALDSQEVRIELGQPDRAALLYPATQKSGEEIMVLLMPVMLSKYG